MDFHTTTSGNRCANGLGFWVDRSDRYKEGEMNFALRGDYFSLDRHWTITITLETLADKIQHTMSYDMVAKSAEQAHKRAKALAPKRYTVVSLWVEEKAKVHE
jgi:hypothetical protein